MKKLISFLLAGGLILGVVGAAQARSPAKVWEDPAGDADNAQGIGYSIPGGFDLTGGTIVRKGANIEFTVTHADMPPSGSMPEGARFLWNFNVNKTPFRLTVKSADLGKPDVAGGQTTERAGRVDVQGHFRLEGKCVTDATLPMQRVNCPVVGYYSGTFDPSSMSFTAVIPMSALKAKPGSKIVAGGENICTICWVSHLAERSLGTTLIDAAAQTGSYKIPR